MGQGQSSPPPAPRSHEELVKELANRFATKCFTSLELYSLKDNFKSLADATNDCPHVAQSVTQTGDPDAGGDSDSSHDGGERTDRRQSNAARTRKHRVLRYLKEDTVARFLAIPDILGASPIVFQMLSYLGAFPFLGDAPAVLGLEQLVIVVTLLTDRYQRVLAHGASDRRTLLFRSLAVHDRKLFSDDKKEAAAEALRERQGNEAGGNKGFDVDAAIVDDHGDDDDEGVYDGDDFDGGDGDTSGNNDDELVLAAFEALDYVDSSVPTGPMAAARKASEIAATLHGARIPADNFRRLLMLLLLVAPLSPQEQLSLYAGRFTGDALDSLRETAQCVLATFLDVETSPGIKFAHFDAIIPVCFPFIFGGFNALFEHFLFSKNLDLSRMKPGAAAAAGNENTSNPGVAAAASSNTTPTTPARRKSSAATIPPKDIPLPPLLLSDAVSHVMNLNILSQLSFFIPGSSLFHRLRPLYFGDSDGFSMGSFETKVFNWRAPTIMLVKGSRISDRPRGQEAAFDSSLPPRRFPHGNGKRAAVAGGSKTHDHNSNNDDDDDETLIFGAYISQPWRMTHRECFGDSETVLFQLSPVHDVFGASTINHDYVAFVKPSAANQHAGGIGLGCPSPMGTAAKASLKQKSHAASEGILPLGPLSLMIDANFEFGVMTHDRGRPTASAAAGSGAGGAFHVSAARMFSFQDRFSIEALEVWGCGGDAEAQAQAERWAWEAREAESRRRINLGTGDIEADRALLEMAGLVGANRSGGSMV
ncbi:Restriction of telomere capping protein 5 [Sporothrix curviconia]|uniref:Restriction of telomere capping protein 5 n=1 Tax=Sporothrix curviconia TaxID=1260050 RepID=A0ABP0CZM2_9PEZI